MTTLLGLGLVPFAVAALVYVRPGGDSRASLAVRFALVMSSSLILFGFLISNQIYNSDNYRYLVFLLVPWSIGLGMVLAGLSRKGTGGLILAVTLAIGFAGAFSLDTWSWYERLGWIGRSAARTGPDDPVLAWFEGHPEVDSVFGDYWDVYRIALETRGRIEGVPYPHYPDRFGAAPKYPGLHPRVLISRGEVGPFYRHQAMAEGGRVLFRGRDFVIIDWPSSP